MLRIPILKTGQKPCKKYVIVLEEAIQADGCSGATEVYHDCCVFHDLAYRIGIDYYGHPVNRKEADVLFRQCMQSHSKLGRFSPMSWWRYAAVRLLGHTKYPKTTPSFETYLWRP
jgi:hypothetical protein